MTLQEHRKWASSLLDPQMFVFPASHVMPLSFHATGNIQVVKDG